MVANQQNHNKNDQLGKVGNRVQFFSVTKKNSVHIDLDCELLFRRALSVESFAGLRTHLSRKD